MPGDKFQPAACSAAVIRTLAHQISGAPKLSRAALPFAASPLMTTPLAKLAPLDLPGQLN
jgi:hypothetical protein